MVKTSNWKIEAWIWIRIVPIEKAKISQNIWSKLGYSDHSGTHCLHRWSTERGLHVGQRWSQNDLLSLCQLSLDFSQVNNRAFFLFFENCLKLLSKKKLPKISNMWPLWPKIRIHSAVSLTIRLTKSYKKISIKKNTSSYCAD